MKVIGSINPCHSPAQNPAGSAPGCLYFEFDPATASIFAMFDSGSIYSANVKESCPVERSVTGLAHLSLFSIFCIHLDDVQF